MTGSAASRAPALPSPPTIHPVASCATGSAFGNWVSPKTLFGIVIRPIGSSYSPSRRGT